jgi:hypothetical protein
MPWRRPSSSARTCPARPSATRRNSGVVAFCLLGAVFVREDPGYLWPGLACIAVGTVFYELATVFYNSLLPLVSTRRTVGRVSAFGWSMGAISAASCCSRLAVLLPVRPGPGRPAPAVPAEDAKV